MNPEKAQIQAWINGEWKDVTKECNVAEGSVMMAVQYALKHQMMTRVVKEMGRYGKQYVKSV